MKECDKCGCGTLVRMIKIEIHDVERCSKEMVCLDLCQDCIKETTDNVWASLRLRNVDRESIQREHNIL